MRKSSINNNVQLGLSIILHKGISRKGRTTWLCKCFCGNTFEVSDSCLRLNIKNNNTKFSCGCLRLKAERDTIKGSKYYRLYSIWSGMLSRCNNPNREKYKNYGQRGIQVEFKSYKEFKKWAINNGYKNNLSIERIDVNGNYSISNCTWIPLKDQKYNKTNSRRV